MTVVCCPHCRDCWAEKAEEKPTTLCPRCGKDIKSEQSLEGNTAPAVERLTATWWDRR